MALLEHELGDEAEAEERYRQALLLDPYFLPAHFNLATMLNTQGRNQEAVKVLRDAIKRDPEQGELYFSLSLLLAEVGDMHGASDQLERAAELLPTRARVHYNLGLTKQHLGERQAAEAALLSALILERNEPDFMYALSIFYMQGEDWALALRYAEQLVAAAPTEAGPRDLLTRIKQSAAAAAQGGK
jgi:tetratricopeptide (TPR) repeat protein